MSSWLFQFNPDKFDGDGYLGVVKEKFAWRVTMYRNQIRPADRVFIWKAMGTASEPSGVVAEAVIVDEARWEKLDPAAEPFIRDPTFPREQHQAWLQLVRSRAPQIAISREAAVADEILHGMSIFGYSGTTNHRLMHEQAERITALWQPSQ